MRLPPQLRKFAGHTPLSRALHREPEELSARGVRGLLHPAFHGSGAPRPAARRTPADHHASRKKPAHSRESRSLISVDTARMLRAGNRALATGEIWQVGKTVRGGMARSRRSSLSGE